VALGAFSLAGCDKGGPPATDKTTTASGTSAVPAAAATYEIACAKCIYAMPGVPGCATAVKAGGKTFLLTGSSVDIMAIGGCTAPKQATIEGKVEGDKFVATKVEVKK
jgi:Family of unknown function (DUF6370)